MNLFVKDYLPTFNKDKNQQVIVIDPGHGGNDPGKVGVNNALEKDINLAIATKLKSYFEKEGYKVVMTRESDKGLYAQSSSNKKRADLQARVKLCNDTNPLIVISIHQNSYQTANCKGAQVFYYDTSTDGEALAGYIQQSLIINVDADNDRKIKANKSYFLLKEIKTTAVIVECGFLSNPEEAEKLTQESYQEQLAFGIHAGVVAYLENKDSNQNNNENVVNDVKDSEKDKTTDLDIIENEEGIIDKKDEQKQED